MGEVFIYPSLKKLSFNFCPLICTLKPLLWFSILSISGTTCCNQFRTVWIFFSVQCWWSHKPNVHFVLLDSNQILSTRYRAMYEWSRMAPTWNSSFHCWDIQLSTWQMICPQSHGSKGCLTLHSPRLWQTRMGYVPLVLFSQRWELRGLELSSTSERVLSINLINLNQTARIYYLIVRRSVAK